MSKLITYRLADLLEFPRNAELFSDSLSEASIQSLADVLQDAEPTPIQVSARADGVYIVDGHRRCRALRVLGRTEVLGVDLGALSDDEIEGKVLDHFSGSRQVSLREQAILFREIAARLKKEQGRQVGRPVNGARSGTILSKEEIVHEAARRVGISSARKARDMDRIFTKGSAELQERVNREDVSVSAAIQEMGAEKKGGRSATLSEPENNGGRSATISEGRKSGKQGGRSATLKPKKSKAPAAPKEDPCDGIEDLDAILPTEEPARHGGSIDPPSASEEPMALTEALGLITGLIDMAPEGATPEAILEALRAHYGLIETSPKAPPQRPGMAEAMARARQDTEARRAQDQEAPRSAPVETPDLDDIDLDDGQEAEALAKAARLEALHASIVDDSPSDEEDIDYLMDALSA